MALVGSSNATIYWTAGNGSVLTNDSRVSVYNTPIVEGGVVFVHSILEICGVTTDDTGYYSCVASNAYGYDQSLFFVEVNDNGT